MKNPLRRFRHFNDVGTGLTVYLLVAVILAVVSIAAILARGAGLAFQ